MGSRVKPKGKLKRKPKFIVISEDNKVRIVEVLQALIQRKNSYFLNQILNRIHPSDLALLWDFLENFEQDFILSTLDIEKSADFISELEEEQRTHILRKKNTEWIVDRLEELETDDIVDILKELSPHEVTSLIRKFDKEYSEKIKELLHYPEETAGALMTSNFLAVNENASLAMVIKKLREFEAEGEFEQINFIYVIDKEDHLHGYISIRKLALEPSHRKVKDIMRPPPVIITPYMDQEEVAHIFKSHNLLSLPVVDDHGVLLGKITIDDIVDVLEEEASEDAFKMVGISAEKSLTGSVLKSAQSKLPWLLIHLSATMFAAVVIGNFREILEKYVILVFFMPIVAALGGAIGSQMVAMIVRGLAIRELHLKQIKFFLVRELGAVFLGGLVTGGCVAIFSYLVYDNFGFGLFVALALVLSMLSATLIGVGIPFSLKLFKFDPAAGSSMLVTAFTDILGFYIFLALAGVFL